MAGCGVVDLAGLEPRLSNYRQSLSNTLTGSLQEREDDLESRLDRLTAFALSPKLGCLLWRLKYDHDSTAWKDAINLLSKECDTKPQWAELCLYEWLSSACHRCNGARELVTENRRIVCGSCNGTGLHRASDRSRAAYTKQPMQTVKSKNKTLERIHHKIGEYDTKVSYVMNKALKELD